jgi:hypothetical protein
LEACASFLKNRQTTIMGMADMAMTIMGTATEDTVRLPAMITNMVATTLSFMLIDQEMYR